MAWLDDLKNLRQELDADGYTDELAEVGQLRARLEVEAARLGVADLLNQMNETLLDGQGQVTTDRSWRYDTEFDDEDLSSAEEEIAHTLYWHDGELMELTVSVGADAEFELYAMVGTPDEENEVDAEAADIQSALLAAFRDLVGLNDDDDDD